MLKNTAKTIDYDYNYDDIDEYGYVIEDYWRKKKPVEVEQEELEEQEYDESECMEVIDYKTKKKGVFVKRRKSDKYSTKKTKLSRKHQKKKKEDNEDKLGSSILYYRNLKYKELRAKRKVAE